MAQSEGFVLFDGQTQKADQVFKHLRNAVSGTADSHQALLPNAAQALDRFRDRFNS